MTKLQNKIFLALLHDFNIPAPIPEFRFHPIRRWRFDYAWPDKFLALEVEGGAWVHSRDGYGSGHAHPVRFAGDRVKYSAAAELGWRLLYYLPQTFNTKVSLLQIQRAYQFTP